MNYAQQLLNEGGPVIYLQLILLIVSIAIFLERYLYYYRSQIDTHRFLRGLLYNTLHNGQITEGVSICDSKPYPVSCIDRSVLAHFDKGETAARNAADEAFMTELPKLRRGLKVLACLGNIAPILGLLGTLLSLMSIFDKISQDGHFVPTTELAGDVKSALLTTALGLIVAMSVHLFSFILAEKVEKIVADMEKACAETIAFCLKRVSSKPDDDPKDAPDADNEQPEKQKATKTAVRNNKPLEPEKL